MHSAVLRAARAGPDARTVLYPMKETSMKVKNTALMIALGLATMAAPLAFAADGDGMATFRKEMQTMANKDGMITKKDFMAMMEKKWNAMDKGNKGMLSMADVMRIFSDSKGQ
jgi:hypothetical protein